MNELKLQSHISLQTPLQTQLVISTIPLYPIPEHEELPLAQRRVPTVNAVKHSSRYCYEHNIAKYVSYSSVSPGYRAFIARKIGGVLNRIQSGRMPLRKSCLPFKRTRHGNLFHLPEGKKAVG
jgi:hypothetical protein